MAQIRTATGSFRVEIEGPADAPTLMLSNSLGTNLHMWDPQMPELTQHFRVVRYDSRGHGGSVADAGPYSIASLSRDALSIMDALDLAKVNWLGLSLGGMVGQWLLTHHRDRIDKAVLANTAAQMPPPDLWNGRIRNVTRNGMAAIVDATIERWFTKGFVERAPKEIAAIRKMIAATPAAGYCGCSAAIRDMDQRESIRGITNPVLLISGAHDPATTPAMMELMNERIKGAQWLTLDAAHISNIEQAEAFTRAMREFLA
jgi:3-oxoadipate enol-lactonase